MISEREIKALEKKPVKSEGWFWFRVSIKEILKFSFSLSIIALIVFTNFHFAIENYFIFFVVVMLQVISYGLFTLDRYYSEFNLRNKNLSSKKAKMHALEKIIISKLVSCANMLLIPTALLIESINNLNGENLQTGNTMCIILISVAMSITILGLLLIKELEQESEAPKLQKLKPQHDFKLLIEEINLEIDTYNEYMPTEKFEAIKRKIEGSNQLLEKFNVQNTIVKNETNKFVQDALMSILIDLKEELEFGTIEEMDIDIESIKRKAQRIIEE